ncbi:hypothetical protein [Stieleria maiorica]|uniref:hypothetical protein n=1 Tax=Stieleria maiorica TaxID=2795974 RepID=UPI0011CC1B63|nr:hypothetical protein [Stieleria maiorica]
MQTSIFGFAVAVTHTQRGYLSTLRFARTSTAESRMATIMISLNSMSLSTCRIARDGTRRYRVVYRYQWKAN